MCDFHCVCDLVLQHLEGVTLACMSETSVLWSLFFITRCSALCCFAGLYCHFSNVSSPMSVLQPTQPTAMFCLDAMGHLSLCEYEPLRGGTLQKPCHLGRAHHADITVSGVPVWLKPNVSSPMSVLQLRHQLQLQCSARAMVAPLPSWLKPNVSSPTEAPTPMFCWSHGCSLAFFPTQARQDSNLLLLVRHVEACCGV